MLPPLAALLLAAAAGADFDGDAALRHASALAALGPHPWGAPRTRAAAEYVAAQLRQAGLAEVRLQEFESHGLVGFNAIGVRRGPGPELLVVGAHHDSAPGAPGAYDDGGGVGVLLETARVMAHRPPPPRTLVFVSWDGEEAWSTGRTTTAGSRAYLKSLGPEARNLVAALVIEMCGWKGGSPVLHPIPYPDPLRPGRYVVTPAWLVRAAQRGGRVGRAPLALGDPILSWLYQPGVRTFRVGLYGDDLSFLQDGLPAVFVSDSSFTAYYPWYHKPEDTADKLDAGALARMGRSVLAVVDGLSQAPRGPAVEREWFSAFGHVMESHWLFVLGALSVAPGLAGAFSSRGRSLALRLGLAAAFTLLLARHPVPALWVFFLPNLVLAFRPRRWLSALVWAPLVLLVGLGGVAWLRGFVRGVWLAPWELLLGVAAVGLWWILKASPLHERERSSRA